MVSGVVNLTGDEKTALEIIIRTADRAGFPLNNLFHSEYCFRVVLESLIDKLGLNRLACLDYIDDALEYDTYD